VRLILAVLMLIGGGAFLLTDIPPVLLSWETASEVGTAGFNVYRAPYSSDDFVQVNGALIPAQGDELVGAAYRYEDDDVVPGRRYTYRIEEMEWDGTTNLYPETETVRAGLPRFWIKIEGGVLLVLGLLLLWQDLKR
jgi:hypothetical protein